MLISFSMRVQQEGDADVRVRLLNAASAEAAVKKVGAIEWAGIAEAGLQAGGLGRGTQEEVEGWREGDRNRRRGRSGGRGIRGGGALLGDGGRGYYGSTGGPRGALAIHIM